MEFDGSSSAWHALRSTSYTTRTRSQPNSQQLALGEGAFPLLLSFLGADSNETRNPRARIFISEVGFMTRRDDGVSAIAGVVTEAERCRLEARALIKENPNSYSELAGQPSGWCVVTKKGMWGKSFHVHREESLLREAIQKGCEVLLTVGIVADPSKSLSAQNHVAVVKVSDRCKLSGIKLNLLTSAAKIRAVSALA